MYIYIYASYPPCIPRCLKDFQTCGEIPVFPMPTTLGSLSSAAWRLFGEAGKSSVDHGGAPWLTKMGVVSISILNSS